MKDGFAIYKKFCFLLLLSTISLGISYSQFVVGGKVIDADGEALPGVNIVEKGTVNGTVSNLDGNYRIQVTSDSAVLIFSFVGYIKEEVMINQKESLNITLIEDITTLDEIVVIGYGTQKKSDLSGSVAIISSDEIENLPIKSTAEALKGRVSGVYVKSNTGQPGSDPSVLVRGRSSISAGNNPLLVVDGIPGVNWSEVDFNDVTSFTVLKDAASAAIYGSSGANGVILLTTKRGVSQKDKISFNYSTGLSLPPGKIDLLNSRQALELVNEMNADGTVSSLLGDQYISSLMIDTANLYNTDWQDQIFRTGISNKYNLSFSGGSDNVSYYISGGYQDDVGYVMPSDHERYSFRTNLDYALSEKLKMSTDFNFTRKNSRDIETGKLAWNGATMLIAMNTYPFLPEYDQNGGYFINPFQPNVDIPPASINGYYGRTYNTYFNSKYTLTYDIINGLSYQFDLMNQTNFKKGSNFRSKYHTDVGRQIDGNATSSAEEGTRWDINNIIRYNKEFGNHNLGLMGGFISFKENTAKYKSNRRGFPSDTIPHVYVENESYPNLSVNYDASEERIEYRKYSYIGRMSYSHKSTYILQANLRIDGSSRFGPKSRWGTFPSGSAAWRLSNENFMNNFNAITNLTIRYSIGITGNDAFGNYLFSSFYRTKPNTSHGMWNNDDVATGYSSLGGAAPNPDLRWEETFEQNIGLDLSLWKNRVALTLEAYIKDANDLLYKANMPPHTGFTSGWLNIGKVNTKGFDINLNTHNISKQNFSWSTALNLSADQNQVIDMGGLGDQFREENIVRKGQPIDAMYGWVMDGIFQNYEEINALNTTMPDGSIVYYQSEHTAPGDIKYRNLNGYETDDDGNILLDNNENPFVAITSDDRQVIGKPNPDFYFGVDNRISYRNFELSVFFQGVYGYNILSLTRREIERMDHFFNYSAVVLDRWKYAGQNTDVPRATSIDPNDNSRTSTRWMEDASYLRMKYLSLSYRIPNTFLEKINASGAVISITSDNLLTFTKYSLYDPEIATNSGSGIDLGGYPQARSFSINVRLEF